MTFDPNKCDGCPIQGLYPIARAHSEGDEPYLIVTDTPSVMSVQRDVPLPPGQMRLLEEQLNENEISIEDFHFHPAILCAYDKTTHPGKENKAIQKHCRQHLLDYVRETSPEVILPLGADAATQTIGKPTKITKVRGLAQQHKELNSIVFPLMSPIIALRYSQNKPIFAADVRSFARLVQSDLDIEQSENITAGEYSVVEDLQFLIDANPEIVAFDTETTGVRWYQPGTDVRTYREELHKGKDWFKPRFQILSMQFCIEPGKSYVLIWDHPERPIPEARKYLLRNQLRKLLCPPDRIVIGQHTKFDQMALWMTEGIRFRIGGDTQMLAAIDDENLPEKNLDVLVKIHVPEMAGYADRFNASVDKERMWEVPIKTLIPYAAGDSDAVYRLYEVLEDRVAADAGCWNHYASVSLPGLNAFGSIESAGLLVDDKVALPEFQAMLEAAVAEEKRSLLSQVPRSIKRQHLEADPKKPAEKVLSFTRQAFIQDVLFNHPDGFCLEPKVFTKGTENLSPELQVPSTSSKDHLPYFFEECPFTLELAEHVKHATILNNNVYSYKEKFIVGGKVRPVYSMAKAVTRRTSSRDPNGQNMVNRGELAKAYKRCFIAPEGYYVIGVDLSQAELRIAGEMAKDPVITAIYMNDGDIHISSACIALGITEEQFARLPEKERRSWRQKAKAINFGFIYGMSWRKFRGYAKTQYGVEFTDQQSKNVREAYFTKYNGLEKWHKNTAKYVRKHGYVRSFSGLIRHLPMVNSPDEYIQAEAIRQAVNSPVQEFGSTLGVVAMAGIHEDISEEYLQLTGFVHDALYAYVPCQYLEWGLKTMRRYMESTDIKAMFGYDFKIPIKADPSFGVNMGDMFELEDFPRARGGYNWQHDCLKDKETGELLIQVPRQRVPPNGGKRTESPYTDCQYEEAPQTVVPKLTRNLRLAGVRR